MWHSASTVVRQLVAALCPASRSTLRRITVDDAEGADEVFEMLMGNDIGPRRDFIVQGAYEVDADTIDA